MEITFLPAELCFAALWLALRIAVWRRQKCIDWKREAVLLLMYANLAVILRYTFFPLHRLDGHILPLVFDKAHVLPFRTNLIPFVRLPDCLSASFAENVLGNAALFLPSGIVLPLVYPRLDRFWKVLAAGAALSLSIELLQLPFAARTTDVDDLVFNTLGVAIGYGIWKLFRKEWKAWR